EGQMTHASKSDSPAMVGPAALPHHAEYHDAMPVACSDVGERSGLLDLTLWTFPSSIAIQNPRPGPAKKTAASASRTFGSWKVRVLPGSPPIRTGPIVLST